MRRRPRPRLPPVGVGFARAEGIVPAPEANQRYDSQELAMAQSGLPSVPRTT